MQGGRGGHGCGGRGGGVGGKEGGCEGEVLAEGGEECCTCEKGLVSISGAFVVKWEISARETMDAPWKRRRSLPAETLYPGIFSPILSPTIPIPFPINPLPTIPAANPIPLSPLVPASPNPFPASSSHSQSQSPLPSAQSSSKAFPSPFPSSPSKGTSTGSLNFLGSLVRVLEAFPWRKKRFGEGIWIIPPALVLDDGGQSFPRRKT